MPPKKRDSNAPTEIGRALVDAAKARDRALAGATDPARTIPTPNWGKWGQMAAVVFHDAIALSCDMSPEAIQRGVPGDLLEVYFERSEILRNHVALGALKVVVLPWGINPRVNHLLLADFARWAGETMGWKIPDELWKLATPDPAPVAPPPAPPPPSHEDKPLHTKERQSMQKMIVVLAHAANFEIEQPIKDADRIVAAAAQLGISISTNTVAGILKAARLYLPKKKPG